MILPIPSIPVQQSSAMTSMITAMEMLTDGGFGLSTYYADLDGDGYGDADSAVDDAHNRLDM